MHKSTAIMAVCTGNICRSAMAEVVLAKSAAEHNLDVEIASSGVSNEEAGNRVDPRAVTALKLRGYDVQDARVSEHRAHKITSGEVNSFDYFVAMTSSHAENLIHRFNVPSSKVYLYRYFEDTARYSPLKAPDLADPWYGGPADFELALDQIKGCASKVLDLLCNR